MAHSSTAALRSGWPIAVQSRQLFRALCVTFIVFALLILPIHLSHAASAIPKLVSGVARITDGDTINIGEVTIRLHGIDAPEVGQTCENDDGKRWRCGQLAMEQLAKLAEGKQVNCTGKEMDAFDRLVAVCHVADIEINAALVLSGFAWAFVKYSNAYVEQEARAKQKKVGIWQGPSIPAWEYRASKWAVAKQIAPDGCPIKGNISGNGRIYHPPWSPWYSRTKVSIEKEERWYCSEREAIDAGWRAPRWR